MNHLQVPALPALDGDATLSLSVAHIQTPVYSITTWSNTPDARAESNDMIYYSRSSLRALSRSDSRQSPHADGYSHVMVCRSRDWKVYTISDVVALQASFTAQTHHCRTRGRPSRNVADETTIVDFGPYDTQKNIT